MNHQRPSESPAAKPALSARLLKQVRVVSEVAHAAVLTWVFFLLIQAVALHFIAQGF